MRNRVISLTEAKKQFINRFTMEHIPQWAIDKPTPAHSGGTANWFYAPQYKTDLEWYENTIFPGEENLAKNSAYCESKNPSWPLGQTLLEMFKK